MRPRIAFSAVVLPAPFGPIRPTMRPASMSKLDAVERERRCRRSCSGRAPRRTMALRGGVLISASSSCRLRSSSSASRPRRWIVRVERGHSSVEEPFALGLQQRARAPAVTNMPSPRRFSTRPSSTSSWYAFEHRESD